MLYYLQLINGETQRKVPTPPIHNEIETFFHHRSPSPVRINSFMYLEEIAGALLLCKVTGSEVYRCLQLFDGCINSVEVSHWILPPQYSTLSSVDNV